MNTLALRNRFYNPYGDEPVPDYLVKYNLDGTDGILTHNGAEDYRIAPACPEAKGSWYDGSTQYDTGNDNRILGVTSSFSLSFWFNTTNKTNSNDIIFFGSNVGASGDGFKISKTSGGTFYIRSNGVSVSGIASPTEMDGNWHHLVVLYDGVNISSYMDGVLFLSPTAYSPTAITNNGVSIAQNRGTGQYDGGLDDVILYNRVLTTDEITARYNYRCDFNPSQITTSLWLDASDVSPTNIVESLGAVSQWSDKSGNGNHVTQGTASLQPTTGSNINGIHSLSYNQDRLNSSLTQLTTLSLYMVLNPTAIGANSNNCPMGAVATAGTGGGMFINVENFADDQAKHEVKYTADLAANKIFIDGQNITNHDFSPAIFSHSGAGLSTEGRTYTIGTSRADNLWQYLGLMGEVILCPDEHDTATRQKLEGYLAWKWGLVANLPSDHPYKDIPPKA